MTGSGRDPGAVGWFDLRLANPEVRKIETACGTWFVSALGDAILERRILEDAERGVPPMETVRRLAPEMEEGTILFIPSQGFSDPRVLAFKSVICSREFFWTTAQDGAFILSDRLADILPELPDSERRLSDRRAVHFLLGCNIRGDWTLVEAINRVGHGELILFEPGGKEPERRKIQRFSWNSSVEDEEESLDLMETALEKVSCLVARHRNSVLMFSGGVDSTLLWTFLRIPALTGFVDTEPAEREIAGAAAKRHGIELRFMPLKESDFLEEYRGAIRDTGHPFISSNYQMLYYRKAFQQKYDHLVSGELADSIWGISHIARIFQKENPREYAGSISSSPLSPEGYGIRVHLLLPDDLPLLEQIYGKPAILELLGRNLSYALDCLDPAVSLERDFRKGHADLGSLAFILNGSWRSNYRQAGYVHGVGISLPFETLSMVRAALSIGLPGRILSPEGQIKPLIHRMLQRRLPGSQLTPKSGSGLPRTRYCQQGPFRDFFREHPLPGFWPQEYAELLISPTWESSSLVLKCISLTMWEEEVLRPKSSSCGKAPPRPRDGESREGS